MNQEIKALDLQDTLLSTTIKGSSGKSLMLDFGISDQKLAAATEETAVESLQKDINSYYGISTAEAFNIQTGVGGKIQKNGKWIWASGNEIKQYFEPTAKNLTDYKFQFLSLAAPAGISEEDARAYLEDKGILKGQEATFIAAAEANHINEIYLMAHACLETGNGTSKLSKGVVYKGTVVYNMFGIKAVDSDPLGEGAAYAYKMGWTTPEKAIMGGAKFISDEYINNDVYKQDTLYEMRWNPASPGNHQYATDVAWAAKQAIRMKKIYECFKDPEVIFDIPIYRK
ncbi:MAG: N-acetylglucosaminidase [Candidatus Cellulosilyticum pullistercoris]|uniref:N-acetylglucosaminidase n=1 Tax=Candidatus Cellulosilyticum pullistercoris TaxID=2838521 RepID=A0A9E2NLZ5_9FIRM|nr:N-acetylglucosaminidase [Candidatus Cellulosilyticum pullistercoris]